MASSYSSSSSFLLFLTCYFLYSICSMLVLMGSSSSTVSAASTPSRLVVKVCQSTTDYAFCESVLLSDPLSSTEDPKVLTGVALRLTLDTATTTKTFIRQELNKPLNDYPKLRGNYLRCDYDYDEALKSIQAAIAALGTGSASAVTSLNALVGYHTSSCEGGFTQDPPHKPSPIADRNTRLDKLADIASKAAAAVIG